MIRYLTWLLCALLAYPVGANDNLPLLYSRENLNIIRNAPPFGADGEPMPTAVAFDVEVRDAESYYNQKDWFSLGGIKENSGLLLVFSSPAKSPIIPANQYAPLDILFVDAQGKITQLLPNIVLSNLTKQIIPQNPVLAFLFLNGQTCQRLNIKPGDTLDYRLFNKSPLVLGDPVILKEAPVESAPEPKTTPRKPTEEKTVVKKSAATKSGKATPKLNLPPLPPIPSIPKKNKASLDTQETLEKELHKKLPKSSGSKKTVKAKED